jgi:hypothetical protein
MAQAAAQCLHTDGSFDRELWASKRRIFETHVVEDQRALKRRSNAWLVQCR